MLILTISAKNKVDVIDQMSLLLILIVSAKIMNGNFF
jgi:hypothetical protein